MMYIIEKANIILSDGTRRNITFDTNKVTDENSCNDINTFKKELASNINERIHILGVKVQNISLTYYEIDGRQ